MRITKNWKNILSIGLAALVLFGAVGAVASFATNDTKTIGFGEFEIGSLNEVDGQYVEDKTAIYTKDAFECEGLKVKPEFDSDVTYQIFWYNEDELYLDCTQKTTLKSAQFVGSTPELAKYARIVIFLSQLDEDGKQIKDFKVSIFDIPKIANNLNITVNKEQEFVVPNLLEGLVKYDESLGTKNEVLLGSGNVLFEGSTFQGGGFDMSEITITVEPTVSLVKFLCSKYSMLKVDSPVNGKISFYFYTPSGEFISNFSHQGGIGFVELPASTDDVVVLVNVSDFNDVVITPYMTR